MLTVILYVEYFYNELDPYLSLISRWDLIRLVKKYQRTVFMTCYFMVWIWRECRKGNFIKQVYRSEAEEPNVRDRPPVISYICE